MGNMDVIELVREKDLDIWLSFGFIINGSQRSFIEIRDMIEAYFEDDKKRGEHIIHGTASSTKLFIVKEKDYEILQEMKSTRN